MKIYTRTFWCETCGAKEEMDVEKIKAHMASVHGLTGPLSGKRCGRSFVDFEGGYSNTFDWKLSGGIKMTELIEGISKP